MGYISPFATPFPRMPEIKGVRLAASHSGMRYKDRDDLLLMEFTEGTSVASIATKSSMPGVPVDWCKSILSRGTARGLVVNAGIANVFTGERGKESVRVTAEKAAALIGCKKEYVFVASTGIIGQFVKDECITNTLPKLHASLSPQSWAAAAKAIGTTDTFPKGATRSIKLGGKQVHINGFTKGSGMIAPDMATMLGFVFTDAAIAPSALQALLNETVNQTYNAITVDSDMSTSDTLLAFATGEAGNSEIENAKHPDFAAFKAAFLEVLKTMAKLVVMDGEGISKFVTITVKGAENDTAARKIALSIANSPLVKTAIAGSDPNWGRIVGAIGKSAQKADRDRTSIWIKDVLIAKNGMLNPDYRESSITDYMKGSDIQITADVSVGNGTATVYTCDLTHEYIAINADYRS